jgi:uncharacterized membrane protein HdeD (DUF308 family)
MSAFSTPSPAPISPDLRHAFGWSIAIAILIILVGFFSILLPLVSGIAIALMVGWFFLFIGILHFLFAWKTHTTRGILWEVLLGILYLAGGLFLFFHPIAGLASLTLFIGAYFLVKGVVQFILFFQTQPPTMAPGGCSSMASSISFWPSSSGGLGRLAPPGSPEPFSA